ncbi:MAG: hypothetical protein JOZ18_15485 [Chloroflexi bacterium]|nr:hypothetical protein [Chloroflexota bacterium]
MYTKNLEQLLRLLRSSRQSGLLTVESAEPDGALWQGQFRLIEGNVVACQVCKRVDGQVLLRNDEALRWMIAQGKLNWHLEEGVQTPETLLPALPPRASATGEGKNGTGMHGAFSPSSAEQTGWIPRRTLKGSQISAKSLKSLEYFQVFTLVNGHNSVEGITRLLRKPSHVVSSILYDLRDAGLIE